MNTTEVKSLDDAGKDLAAARRMLDRAMAEARATMVAARRDGASVYAIAKALGVTRQHVYDVLEEAGLPVGDEPARLAAKRVPAPKPRRARS